MLTAPDAATCSGLLLLLGDLFLEPLGLPRPLEAVLTTILAGLVALVFIVLALTVLGAAFLLAILLTVLVEDFEIEGLLFDLLLDLLVFMCLLVD